MFQYEFASIYDPVIFTKPVIFRIADLGNLLIFSKIIIYFVVQKKVPARFSLQFKILLLVPLFYLAGGLILFGSDALAEYRSKFIFILFIPFLISMFKDYGDLNRFIKQIAWFLALSLLVVPINLLETQNFTINIANRQLGAFYYATGSFSLFLTFYLGKIQNNLNKYFYYLLLFWIYISIYASHRSVWIAVVLTIFLLTVISEIKIKYIFITAIGLIVIVIGYLRNYVLFFSERLNFLSEGLRSDSSGNWRYLVWDAVISEATFLGNGIGARFNVYANTIGYEAVHGSHNLYIAILYYMGWLGVLIYITFLLSTYIYFFKQYRKELSIIRKNIFLLSIVSIVYHSVYVLSYELEIVSFAFIALGFLMEENKPKIGMVV